MKVVNLTGFTVYCFALRKREGGRNAWDNKEIQFPVYA